MQAPANILGCRQPFARGQHQTVAHSLNGWGKSMNFPLWRLLLSIACIRSNNTSDNNSSRNQKSDVYTFRSTAYRHKATFKAFVRCELTLILWSHLHVSRLIESYSLHSVGTNRKVRRHRLLLVPASLPKRQKTAPLACLGYSPARRPRIHPSHCRAWPSELEFRLLGSR